MGSIGNSPLFSVHHVQKLWEINCELPPAVERTLHGLYEEQAKDRPDAPALHAWDGQMTYSQLDETSTRLASYLATLGVEAEELVLLCFEKSLWTVVAMLAVLKAGGAFVPLDPEHPSSRHKEISRQTKAKVVLASVQHEKLLADLPQQVIAVGNDFVSQLPRGTFGTCSQSGPSNIVYVMFTSGSTGTPKGVVLEHRAVATSCLAHGKAMLLSSSARALQFTAYTFDICIAEIFTTLIYGGCVCIPSDNDRRNTLTEAINKMDVNWAQLTPTVARLLDPQSTPSLKVLVLGGERVDSADWERWSNYVTQISVYGPTECSIWCSSHRNGAQAFQSGMIGKPMASVHWIVDADDHNKLGPLDGAVGELLIEGPILARGYLNDAAKTEASFINNPRWLEQGSNGRTGSGRHGRLYKTGDLVYCNADGHLVYAGRKDSQVKVHGQRVELGEIEHHLRNSIRSAKQIAVEVIKPAGAQEKAMVAAFLQPNEEASRSDLLPDSTMSNGRPGVQVVSLSQVDIELGQQIPHEWIPEVYFVLDDFPVTTSAKVDRVALRELGGSFAAQQLAQLRTSMHGNGPKRGPASDKEKTMQQLWASVLGINDSDSIGMDDSFFHFGGDSIAAMRLVGEARRSGIQTSVTDVFRNPTLEQLTCAVTFGSQADTSSCVTIPHSELAGPVTVPQSSAQGRLWFLEELHPGLNWYLMPFAVRIRGPLVLEALKFALCAIEERHETLRTTFDTIADSSVQVIRPFHAKELNIINVLPGDTKGLADAIRQDQTRPFNLRTEPGWRVSLYSIGQGQDDHVLSIVIHHIVADGWSTSVLMRELAAFYSTALHGQSPLSRVQPLPIQYRDFSVWEKQQAGAQLDRLQKQLGYWVSQLDGSRPATLLCDKARPDTLSGQAGRQTFEIVPSLYAALQRFCGLHGVTQFMVLLAVFRATHFRLTGQQDATIGTVNANRDRWEFRDMIGFFVNLQCLRTTIGNEESFEDLVRQVREVTIAALANIDVPFESIVSKLKLERSLSRHPLAQIMFAVHSQRDLGELTLHGLETETLDDTPRSRFDLECHFFQHAEGLQAKIFYSTDLYAPETIESMISVFLNVIEGCLAEPKAVIATLPLLHKVDFSKQEGMGLIPVKDIAAYARELSVVDIFRQQVSICPSRNALIDTSAKMTYAQLDKESDVLARWLARHSLAPETLVGVLASRSCQAIVAFLGILKANLAYLPFDVKLPAKRIQAIISSLPPGRKIVLVGADVRFPDVKLEDVDFVYLTDALEKQTCDLSAARSPGVAIFKPCATSLAYVMFTSGSTGQPKGVMIEHRGIVHLVSDNNLTQHLPASPIMAHMTTLAFDTSTWEIYAALLHGGTLVCIDAKTVLDPEAVLRTFRQQRINTAFMTPSLFRTYVSQWPSVFAELDMLCLGGEALHPNDMVSIKMIETSKVVNGYGPTEITTFATSFLLSKDKQYVNGVPIGRAISSNAGVYVMDSKLQPVPLGVIGELVVTGDGLARGYTDPKRNIDRFVTVDIGNQTLKAYRTGDFVRYRPADGQLEFFGRIDGQVKIRGHRIECGEVDHVLRSHKSVNEAVTVLQRNGNDARLAAFVTVHRDDSPKSIDDHLQTDDESQLVDTWEEQFDSKIYQPISNVHRETLGRDFIGWTSMYDGSDLDKSEMNEWLDDTIDTILDGHQPGKVLEVGTGTGMILFNLGDGLQHYIGLDPSQKAVEFVSKTAGSVPALAGKVRMHKATAADIGHLRPPCDASLVVINSVVQYFPSLDYLFKTVQQLLELESVSTLFIGDVRSYALHREFLATRALRIAGEKASKAEIHRIVADMEQVERELLVDPAFFTALQSRLPDLVEHVEILPKKMKATNELSCYRYAAIIHARSRGGREREQVIQYVAPDEWIDFAERKLDRQSLVTLLQSSSGPAAVAVSNIPYSKTIVSRCLVESLDVDASEHRPAGTSDDPTWLSSVYQQAQNRPSLSVTELHELAQQADFRVETSWSRQHSQCGGLDAIFHRYQPRKEGNRVKFQFPTESAERPAHSLSSTPLQPQLLQRTQQKLQDLLETHLPPYMVPQTITFLDVMPINQSGKVDWRVLEHRLEVQTAVSQGLQREPTVMELHVQQLMESVLGINYVGLDDSFFQLGGDSIAAMKLVGAARQQGISLSVADIFKSPKLVDLAAVAQERGYVPSEDVALDPFSLLTTGVEAAEVRHMVAASCNVEMSCIEDVYPCSPLQEGFLSLTEKRPGDYVMQAVLELRAGVDEGGLKKAWETAIRSIPILRTRIVYHDTLGLVQAVVADKVHVRWAEASDGLQAYLRRDKVSSMRLGQPLARYALIRSHTGGKRWFVWTVHHAIYDGWSLPHILNAVDAAYNGAALPKLPGYNHFIKYLGQLDHETLATYWRATLGGCEAKVFPLLPPGTQQPVADTTAEYRCPPLPQGARTSRGNTTIPTLLRAAWAIVQSRYTSSDDVVFGATVTGRNAPVVGIEFVVGPVIATVPIRMRLRRGSTVPELLEEVQRQATDMIPFEQTGLQRIAKLGPDLQHACRFQTLLIVQPAEDAFHSNDALGTWEYGSELQDFTTYTLMVQCKLDPEGVSITASFDARLIQTWQVDKMLAQLGFVVQQLAQANPSTRVMDIDMVTPSDRQQLWKWNHKLPPAVERCVHDLYSEQAKTQPKALAIDAWDGRLTYGELDERSSRLAAYLTSIGVKPESMVPLCFEKSIWVVVAMLAVLKAGGAFVPLAPPPEHPISRHKDIFDQTKARVVLASERYATLWSGSHPLVVPIGQHFIHQLANKRHSPKTAAGLGVHPHNPAYVIFTSGSTGTPKGVVLEHQAVSTECLAQKQVFGITKDTRGLQFASYTFDACIPEIITILIHGGCVCIPSKHEQRNNLVNTMNKMKINWALLTPAVARMLDPQEIISLRTLVLGAEKVNTSDCKRWSDRVQLVNAFGPTECCVACAANPYIGRSDLMTIGKSLASVSWVVDPDDHNRLAPLGATGELLVEGPILARGYLDDAKRTEDAFIETPPWLSRGSESCGGRHGRLYKTGDLVRYCEDGDLMYMGRKDNQVKVRGQRIELGEIEHHLYQCVPDIRQVAAEIFVPTGGRAMVAAFLETSLEKLGGKTADDGSAVHIVSPTLLEEELARRLPREMVPEVFFAVKEMPTTTSTKIDRRRLRELGGLFSAQQIAELRTKEGQGSKRQPESEREKLLQHLWAQVLSIDAEHIGLDDTFFRLGGDSIAAMKLVNEARNAGLNISVQNVFEAQRLGQLANQSLPSFDDTRAGSVIPKANQDGPVAQSFAQGRLWFLEQLHPGLYWYLVHLAVRIRGPLQLHALQAALQAVQRRHETLRTTFSTKNGEGLQEVHPFRDGKELKIVDVWSDDDHILADALRQEQMTPFNLESEPGWRVCIFRINEQHHVLSIVMHHIVADGWSVDILKTELSALYAAVVRGDDPVSHLPPLPIQYRDFSVWQRLPGQIQEHQRQLAYWTGQLNASRPAEFLCDKPRPATLSGKAGTQELKINCQLYEKIQRFARARGVTMFTILFATFRAAHYRLTNQDDATVGVPNANRAQWEVGKLIGFFVNMQCLRIKIQDETFEELVHQVHTTTVAALANQEVPFEVVVSALQGDRDLSRNPLAQVAFAVHSQQDVGKLEFEGTETEAIETLATTRFDLECHFFQGQGTMEGYIYFAEELFAAESIFSLASVFMSLLENCLDKPETRISVAPLMTDQAHARLNDMGLLRMSQTSYSRDSSIIDVFQQQAAVQPSKIAVKDTFTELTYAQLETLSDRLANFLAMKSIAPETAVGVLAHRSCQAIVAFLGILKAGLAYLPFDSKAPEQRMRSILSSIRGNTLILVGQNIELPSGLENVEFAHIVEILDAKGDPECTRRKLNILRPCSTSLAYILFTSGSTGQPKGVMVEHRGLVRLAQHEQVNNFQSAEATAHMANLAFDGSSWEIYTCLLNGGTLVCIDSDTVLDQDAILRAFVQYKIRVAFITPALLHYILAKSPETISHLETLLVAGDRADRDDLFKARRLVKRHVVANAYGPTENSVMSTLYILPEDEPCVNGVPIGRSIDNSAAYVMDPEQKIVPLGVVGELVVTGDGLARGYTDPKRNVDRFVMVTIENETSGNKTIRAYRTGDYVRQRPTDGSMEFFGRIDGQVKIRGFRVELGEIESVLRGHDLVHDAVVVADHREDNIQRLFGYVTLKEGSEMPGDENGDDNQVQHVTAWEDRFDSEQYATLDSTRTDTQFGHDFIGWTSMYDGSDIPRNQMSEWLNETIDSIHYTVGGQLGSVLEIGSGSGMILFNLGKSLKKYTGFEPSRNALNFVIESTKSMASLTNKVEMYKATAADISQVKDLQADLVILNSVVQYFPSQDYLFKVVHDLLLHVDGAQALFFGDVRSYALQEEFFATRAACMAGGSGSKETLQRMMEDMEGIERELLVDPGFFTSLTHRLPHLVQHVEIRPKKMKATNELSCYRYTAVVYTSSWRPPFGELRGIPDKEWIDFQEQNLDRASLQQRLQDISTPMAISNIPYSKTLFGRCLLRFLRDDKARKPAALEWEPLIDQEVERIPSLSAVDLDEIAKGAFCDVEISWNRQYSQQGGLDAIFYPRQTVRNGNKAAPMFRFPTDHTNRRQWTFSNRPLQQQLAKKVQQQLDQLIRSQLPSYMVPQSIHVLDKLPINQNGKVDRAALLSRTRTDTAAAISQNSQQRELTSSELKVQQLLARVLHIHTSRIGLDDSFFQLGGDSIAAMKLVAAAREDGIQLTVAEVFKHPRLVDLATVAQSAQHEDAEKPTQPFSLLSPPQKDHLLHNIPATSNVDRNDIIDIYPATWMQNLYISRGVSRRPLAFNYFYLDLGPRVDASRLRCSLSLLLRHFATLRTKFVYVDGKLWAIVLRDPEVSFTEIELDAPLDEASDTCCLKNSQNSDALEWPTAFFLVRSANGQNRLVIRVSHACYDGVSFPSYLKTLLAFYFGEPVDPSHDFSTYLAYKHGTKSASTRYWRTLLKGSRMTQATPVLGSKLGSESVDVYTERVITMPQLPKDITLASLNSAAWAKVLNHVTGEEDVVYGTMIAGRNSNIPTITKIVGPCVNIIPVRARVRPTTTPAELVRSIQEQFIALGEADSMQFDELVRHSTDWPGDTHFDSVFQHQGLNEHPEYVFDGIKTKLHWFQNPESIPCILTVVSFPLGDKLKIVVRGNEHIITLGNAVMIRDKLCDMIHKLASSLQK